MIKFALGLIVLLIGSVAFALIRKARYGGPIIERDGEPRSLSEMVERQRYERQRQEQGRP
jgi:hypothetical protein